MQLRVTQRSMGCLVTTAREDDTLVISLNQPKALNALTETMGDALQELIPQINADKSIRSVVLTGAGSAFSAGGDLDFLNERVASDASVNTAAMLDFYHRFLCIRQLRVPVIAAINGHAIGAGLCLATACDLRVVARDALLGYTFVGLGLHPGMAATHFVQQAIGPQLAARMLFTGEKIKGEEAVRRGLALSVHDADDVLPEALKIAEKINDQSAIAVQTLVQTLRRQNEVGLERALQREADAQAHCYAHADMKEGLAAIVEKRKPNFD